MQVEIYHPMFCPVCGEKVEIDNPDRKYCDHVEFVYGWAEDNFFVYVNQSFGRKYLNALSHALESKDYLEDIDLEMYLELEDGLQIPKDQANLFASGKFEPMDEVSKLVPYSSKIALSSGPNLVFYVECGTYSGASVGIKCMPEEE